jgi:hypothetical protein
MLLLICPRCLAFVGLGNFLQAVSSHFLGYPRRWCAAQIQNLEGHLVAFHFFLPLPKMTAQAVMD